ncbi:MAG: zinc ABC transporter substrate-binding protein [Proteobacteria bacterium]|nr:zinc ABC transporter substrate-binding protein [Pseudomonadota bacterium]
MRTWSAIRRRLGRGSSALAAALALVGLPGCGDPEPREAAPRFVVAVTLAPQAWFVERLAGEAVDVRVVLPSGASPISHEPSLADVRAVARAQLYVKLGHPAFPFEQAWLAQLLDERQGLRVVDGMEGVRVVSGDPHVWLSPAYARGFARRLHAALRESLPERGPELDAGLAELLREIDGLDAELRQRLAPHRGRTFAVQHPAWGAFAREYGLEQLAVEHEHKSPDLHAVQALLERLRADALTVVFVQPQFDPAGARALASELGVRVETLDPLAPDWAENLRRAGRLLAESFAS